MLAMDGEIRAKWVLASLSSEFQRGDVANALGHLMKLGTIARVREGVYRVVRVSEVAGNAGEGNVTNL